MYLNSTALESVLFLVFVNNNPFSTQKNSPSYSPSPNILVTCLEHYLLCIEGISHSQILHLSLSNYQPWNRT